MTELILSQDCFKEACFDLQFRKDVKHNRPKNPTYYRWKAQFVILLNKEETELLKKIKTGLGCGRIHLSKDKARYSVQNIDNLYNIIIPLFKQYQLPENKKKDFGLWSKALKIIYRNKGKSLLKWKKKDFQRLIELQKLAQRYKEKSRSSKWISIAESLAETL